jgi:hypothetical protein
MLELGALISSLINLIPDGVVVFFPSYTFLNKVKEIWQASGLLDKLDQRKKVGEIVERPPAGIANSPRPAVPPAVLRTSVKWTSRRGPPVVQSSYRECELVSAVVDSPIEIRLTAFRTAKRRRDEWEAHGRPVAGSRRCQAVRR